MRASHPPINILGQTTLNYDLLMIIHVIMLSGTGEYPHLSIPSSYGREVSETLFIKVKERMDFIICIYNDLIKARLSELIVQLLFLITHIR